MIKRAAVWCRRLVQVAAAEAARWAEELGPVRARWVAESYSRRAAAQCCRRIRQRVESRQRVVVAWCNKVASHRKVASRRRAELEMRLDPWVGRLRRSNRCCRAKSV